MPSVRPPVGERDMRSFLLILLFFHLGFAHSFAQDQCNLTAILNDDSDNGTAVYDKPDGKVKDHIKPAYDAEGMEVIHIVRTQSKWVNIKWDSKKVGWVKSGSIGVWTRNQPNQTARLYSEPDKKSKVLITLPAEDEQFAIILDCKDGWAFVRVLDSNKKTIKGWLPPEFQCAEPHTSCT
jgi:hypothetical protein